jgi:hypothetical protein
MIVLRKLLVAVFTKVALFAMDMAVFAQLGRVAVWAFHYSIMQRLFPCLQGRASYTLHDRTYLGDSDRNDRWVPRGVQHTRFA